MRKSDYRAIHTAIVAVWGKPNKCELCKGENKSKRFEWANKDHKYSLDKKDWRQLCATCHRRWDRKHFDRKPTWNKGMRKERPTLVCEWCGKYFFQKRTKQILCSTKCAGHRNGNIIKRKKVIY